MFDRLGELASEHAELERALADPGVHADADQARTLAKRYAELTPIVNAYREWQQVGEDEQAALELAAEDSAFGQEAAELAKHREELEAHARQGVRFAFVMVGVPNRVLGPVPVDLDHAPP